MERLDKKGRLWDLKATRLATAVVKFEEQSKKHDLEGASLSEVLPEEARVQKLEFVGHEDGGLPHIVLLTYPCSGMDRIEWIRRIEVDFPTGRVIQDVVQREEDFAPTPELALRARHTMNWLNTIK